MNIVHYIIGVPPFRHGGASKYALDLALEQSKTNKVFLLFPGDTLKWGNRSYFSKGKDVYSLSCFTIQNPVVSPLLFGIKEANAIMDHQKKIDDRDLERFHTSTLPDVVHLHTLMGIPESLLLFWKKKKVKIIMTSHDYYGICLKANFINDKDELCKKPGGAQCASCNQSSKGYWFLKLCNSSIFLKYKHLIPLKATHFKGENKEKKERGLSCSKSEVISFGLLIEYYKNFFSLIDFIHFNSTVAEETYLRFINVKRSRVVPITTNKITDRRIVKKFDIDRMRLGFVGGVNVNKGFPMLKTILIELYSKGISNFTLDVWEDGLIGIDKECPLIRYNGKYNDNQLVDVFTTMDLLIVPSIWKETFSLVALESLSFGTPVVVSDNVGAKIIVKQYDEKFIYSDKEELKSLLEKISKDNTLLQNYHNKLVSAPWDHLVSTHSEDILSIYSELIKL